MREPPIKNYFGLICHNQVAITIGSNDIKPIAIWWRMLVQWLNGDTALQNACAG